MNKWQAIIFDLDDTLYPERDYVFSGFKAVADWGRTALHLSSIETYRQLKLLFDEGVRGDTFNRWIQMHGLDAGLLDSLIRVYREHVPVLQPFAGARELLESLRKSYRLGLISDGYLDVQKTKFASLGLEPFFEVVIFSDQWGREHWKPHVRPFRTAAELLHLKPSEMLYVADNPAKDFFGARKLQTFTVRLRREGGEYAKLSPISPDYAPDVTVTSFDQLHSLLASPGQSA